MKKIIVLLCLIVVCTTGCTNVISPSDNGIDTVIDEVLLKNSKLSNTYFEGYKYYVPRGLSFVNKDQFNALLQDGSHNCYYLYVDAVSYYHNIQDKYQENSQSYYSRKLRNGKDFGYVEINKVGKKYFIEAMYRYAKIEVYVKEREILDAICNISYILSSMKYNRSILETLVGENVLNYKEEEFDIFKSKRTNGDFLDYVEEYGKYYDKDNELPDQDNVEIEEEN